MTSRLLASVPRPSTGLPLFLKSQGKRFFFKSHGKVREFKNGSGKKQFCPKVRERSGNFIKWANFLIKYYSKHRLMEYLGDLLT